MKPGSTGIYTCRNKIKSEVIGSIDRLLFMMGPLPFEPGFDLEVT